MTSTVNRIEKYHVEAQTITPMHIGSGEKDTNEILVHPLTDLPFIQASSIAGVLRSVSEVVNGKDLTTELFGNPHIDKDDSVRDVCSRIKISDGVFAMETVRKEYRPRVKLSRQTGSVSSGRIAGSGKEAGHKFEMEMIGKGAMLSFTLYLSHEENDGHREALEHVLAECSAGRVRFGGQKSNGGGVIRIYKLYRQTFDLTDSAHRAAWVREKMFDHVKQSGEGNDIPPYELLSLIPKEGTPSSIKYEVNIAGRTEGALLVKGISVEKIGAGAADAANMQNSAGEYIVPGSSFKGTLRSRMEQLAEMLGKQSLISIVFGGNVNDTIRRGNLLVQDIIVFGKNREKMSLLQHRIHIDKFTGGVMQSGLFAEETISGDLSMHIDIENRNDPDATAGLLILALRDMASGVFNLGSGYSVGRGFVHVSVLQLKSCVDEKIAEINFETGIIKDKDHVLDNCLHALNNWKEV